MPGKHIDQERTEWPFHPLADIFPMMDEAALAELAADIEAESQREPIHLWQGQIIDGRNRYRRASSPGSSRSSRRSNSPAAKQRRSPMW